MSAELVNYATSDKLTEMDWTKNIEICELVARDHRQAKDVIKAIKKRLGSKNPNIQIFAVNLLEMLINNIGEPVHKQVIDTRILPLLVKLVKKKSENPVREKVFLLLDEAQTSLGGASGRFPEYHAAYYELVSAGLQFPERPSEIPKPKTSSSVDKNSPPVKETVTPQYDTNVVQTQDKTVPESSIIQKANTALEVLRDVLDTVDTQHPEEAKDEFTLDLVEQCSFQKQRVMHLAITSRDENTVSRAVELNEQLERMLRRHDDLVAGRSTCVSNHINYEHEEEEEEEQLFRRIRKGKACVRPEDEDHHINRSLGLSEMLKRPLIRPITTQEPIQPQVCPTQEISRPLVVELKQEPNVVAIPPPPSKHIERERFFQENKSDGNAHMRLHSRNASSSRSGSVDFSSD